MKKITDVKELKEGGVYREDFGRAEEWSYIKITKIDDDGITFDEVNILQGTILGEIEYKCNEECDFNLLLEEFEYNEVSPKAFDNAVECYKQYKEALDNFGNYES